MTSSGGAMSALEVTLTRIRPWVCVLCTLIVVSLAACRTYNPTGPPPPTLQTQPVAPIEPYLLHVGDSLAIKFYFNPDLNEEVIVRPDGMISLQLIGDVQAAGLTPTALAGNVTQKYTAELANPKVSVIVRQFAGQVVYVGGEVGKEGIVPLTGGLTLFQAIQVAGGFLDTAHEKQVILIRKGADGRPTGAAIDLRPVLKGEQPQDDVLLQPFDVVFVPKSKIADIDVVVDQYMRRMLPPIPFAIPAF